MYLNLNPFRKSQIRILAATAGAMAALCTALPVQAEEAAPVTTATIGPIEEVLVTARKREERLDDVPISVSVVSGDRLEALGAVHLDQVVQSMPGVAVTPTPVGDLLFIRGIGSGENQGFEMSVGTFIDSVYFGRGRSARHAFLDVDHIEVLKGPQPVMFGKNTIGGAFNITTRKPSDTPEGYLEEYVEPQFKTFQTTGVISGPVSDTVNARIVLRSYMTDGYMDNDFTGKSEPRRRDWVGRGTVVWTPREDLEVTFKGEYGRNNMEGGFAQITKASPLLTTLVHSIDPKAEFVLNDTKSGPGTKAPFDSEYDKGDTYNGTVTVNWDIGGFALTSVSSYVGYDLKYSFDSDFTPLNLVQQLWNQHWNTWAQEVRLASPTGRTFEYTAGVYLSTEQFKNDKIFAFDFSQTPISMFGSAYRVQNFKQNTQDASAFAEGTWNATDTLSFVGGVRYTYDKKTADKGLYWADFGSLTPNPAITNLTAIGLGKVHHYTDLGRSTENASVELTAQYHPGNMMYYASYKQGFKAGGFDEGNSNGILNDIVFDDERANSYEAGVKGRLLDGRLIGRAAMFYSVYDNLQVSIFDGVAALVVGNAAKASSKGFEFEQQLAVTDKLMFGLSATYLDAHYVSYANGPCSYGKGASCDLSGDQLPYSPKWSGTLNARWVDRFDNGWVYALDADLFYSSSFFTAGDLDPFVAQTSFAKLGASATLTSPDGAWTISIIGKNLTDKTTSHFGDDIPLSNILGNNYQQYVDPPRTVAFRVRYNFL